MDFTWLAQPQTWVGFATLLILEVVLGIDNLVFVAILANKVKPALRDKARILGLSLAVCIRMLMMGLMTLILTLKQPLFFVAQHAISGKDLIMLGGGLFLLYKATTELHERLEGNNHYQAVDVHKKHSSFWAVVAQILILDAVFSIDSVITAVAMVEHISVAMGAIAVAMVCMIFASKALTDFVDKHPTVVMLCLGFLLMIGFSLIAEGFHFHIPKGYLYVAIGFSILIEIFNQVSQKNTKKRDFSGSSWRQRTADSVLGLMGIRESLLAQSNAQDDQEHFEENEKSMIRNILTLAERPILGVMIPRSDIEKLDISASKEEQKQQLLNNPYSRMLVVGKNGVDEPIGYINKKDVLIQVLQSGEIDIDAVKKQPLMLPETITALEAIELFRKKTADYALVIDEFGTTQGMLTLKDLMETIAGELPEAYESQEEAEFQTHADGSLTVDGAIEYVSLAPKLNLPPLSEEVAFHTVAGLLMEQLQKLPDVGDDLDYHGWRFSVVEKEGHRIARININRIKDEVKSHE